MKLYIKRRNNKISFSNLGFAYIISMIFIEIAQSGIISVYYLTPFIIGFVWFLIALLQRSKIKNNEVNQILLWLIIPWFIFIAYNFFLFVSGNGFSEFTKSSFVQIMFTPCILLAAWSGYTLFGNSALKYLIYATIMQYIIVQTIELFNLGIVKYFEGIATVFTGNSIGNPMEQNSDVILSLGILIIFLMDNNFGKNNINYGNLFLAVIVFLLGGKKICFLAMAAIVLYMMFAKLIPERKRIHIQTIISFLFIIVAFVYVYIIEKGIFSDFVWEHGINTMGRVNMWNYVSKFFDFKISYLGRGYSFCNLILERDRPYTYLGHVYALHNDVLKVFVDLGFVIFTFWLIYNLLYLTKKFNKKFGFKVSNLYWATTIYLFMLYLTDNAINYYITQTMYVLVLAQSAIMNKQITEIDRKL